MNRIVGLGALALFGLAGCGAGRGTHLLVSNADETVQAGTCHTEGPYAIPAGASMTYDIYDVGDNMDVGFSPAADGCDLTNGFAVLTSSYWGGRQVDGADNLPGDTYYFVINCYNTDGYPCLPTLNSWTWDN
jgi:hypothetical protein